MAEQVVTTRDSHQHQIMVLAVAAGLVLRLWNLGGSLSSYDEAFTGVYSHLPLSQIPSALRADDAHPPLDYLIRHFFGATGDTLALRLPSVFFACATLVLVAWWMWDRCWFGVLVVALTSASYFELFYGHMARMYALGALCGTAAAIGCEWWLERDERRWIALMAAALLVGLFTHASFLLLAGGLLVVPGLRRDRRAWEWRASVVGALALWGLVWGAAFLAQSRGQHSNWIPLTSVRTLMAALNGLVSPYPALDLLGAAAVIGGLWALGRVDRRLDRVALCLFALPFVVACLLGLHAHFLLPRTLVSGVWAAPVAVAALVEWARRRSDRQGLVVGGLVAALVVASIGPAVTFEEGSAPALRALQHVPEPGDAVAVPEGLWPLSAWNLDGPPGPTPSSEPEALRGAGVYAWVPRSATFNGRVWLYAPADYEIPAAWQDWVRCGEVIPDGGDYRLRCLVAGAPAPGTEAPSGAVVPAG